MPHNEPETLTMPKIRRRPYIVHIVGPAWMHGGTEQHANTLSRFFDPSRVRIDAVHVTTTQFFDRDFQDETHLNVRETPPDQLEAATAEADCVLHWGIELDAWLPPSRRQARIHIAHGCSEWGEAMIAGSVANTDHLIAVSQHVADRFKLGHGHTVIRNGIDTARLTNTVGALTARQMIGATDGTFVIGYLGRLAADKRVERIIEATQLMDEDTIVLICGCGPEESNLRKLAAQCGNTRVRFTYLSQYLGDFFQTLDTFVMPSEHEGFCLAIAEAMWSSVPVISTKTGLAASDIIHEFDGIITDDPGRLTSMLAARGLPVPPRY